MDERILNKILGIAEQFFGTASDPDQIPITKESFYKLQKLHPKTVVCKMENGEPVSWVVILPTSNALAEKFLKGEITERELLNKTEPQERYEALYLCAAFTVPEFRRKGYIIELGKEAIEAIPHIENVRFFAWPVSKEGKLLAEKGGQILKRNIELRYAK